MEQTWEKILEYKYTGINGILGAALLECNTGKLEDNAERLEDSWSRWSIEMARHLNEGRI